MFPYSRVTTISLTSFLLQLFSQFAASSLIGDSTQSLGNILGGLPVGALTGVASGATGGLLGNLTGGAGGLLGGVTGSGGGLLNALSGGGLLGGPAGDLLGGQGGGDGGAGNILNISIGSPVLGTLLALLAAIVQLLHILIPLAAALL